MTRFLAFLYGCICYAIFFFRRSPESNATPVLTVGHLVFSMATTGYIFIGIVLEELDLVAFFGPSYLEYQQRVPALFPLPHRHA